MAARALLAVLLMTAAPCLADESPVPGTLKQFGLLGTWAIETLSYARGGPYRDIVYEIRTAAPVAEARLALHVLGLPGRYAVDLVLLKEGDTVRVWSSHTPDGRMLVIDGVITGNGRPSPRFTRCR
jgi:hypothetical protein